MKPTHSLFSLLLAFAILCAALLPTQTHAEPLDEIKQRMKERLSEIDRLKQSEKVGVTNQGYLKPLKDLDKKEANTIAEENIDRKTVYAYIANKANVSLAKVEKQRAAELSKRSAKGVWLQDSKGEWYRKK